MPDARLLHEFLVSRGEILPALRRAEAALRVEQARLQLKEARHLRHDPARLLRVEQRADRGERVAERVVAAQHLHRRPRAAVGRAEHEDARAFDAHQALPHLRRDELHRAHDEPAHRMRDDAHRLSRLRARVERVGDGEGETGRFLLDRHAPVVGERRDVVRRAEELDQLVVGHADRAVGLDARRAVGARLVAEPVEPVDDAPAQPHALVADLQVAAEDAGQHDQRGLCRVVRRGRAAQAARILAGPGKRSDGAKAGRHRRFDERGRDCVGGGRVGEIAEVRDLARLVEEERRGALARHAAVHRPRLHDEVVVGPEERVGEQRLEPRGDRIAFHVARHDAQVARQRRRGRMHPADQRAVGRLRGEPRRVLRIEAGLRDAGEQFDERRRNRHLREFERPLQHRQVRIQPVRREQRAAHRTRDAHDPVDGDGFRLDLGGQRLQFREALCVILEDRLVRRADDRVRADSREHFGHEPAARMRHQVQAVVSLERLDERQRVLDRAHAERRMI